MGIESGGLQVSTGTGVEGGAGVVSRSPRGEHRNELTTTVIEHDSRFPSSLIVTLSQTAS